MQGRNLQAYSLISVGRGQLSQLNLQRPPTIPMSEDEDMDYPETWARLQDPQGWLVTPTQTEGADLGAEKGIHRLPVHHAPRPEA